jgi:hypothetical protein
MRRVIEVILLCACLSACATGYQKYSLTGGYKDKDLGDGKYLVEYYGNGTTSEETVEEYWSQRASELCPSGFETLDTENGANDGGFLVGGAVSIAHPWKKSVIHCR